MYKQDINIYNTIIWDAHQRHWTSDKECVCWGDEGGVQGIILFTLAAQKSLHCSKWNYYNKTTDWGFNIFSTVAS